MGRRPLVDGRVQVGAGSAGHHRGHRLLRHDGRVDLRGPCARLTGQRRHRRPQRRPPAVREVGVDRHDTSVEHRWIDDQLQLVGPPQHPVAGPGARAVPARDRDTRQRCSRLDAAHPWARTRSWVRASTRTQVPRSLTPPTVRRLRTAVDRSITHPSIVDAVSRAWATRSPNSGMRRSGKGLSTTGRARLSSSRACLRGAAAGRGRARARRCRRERRSCR